MKFEEILPYLRNGEKIRQDDWKKGEYICIPIDSLLIRTQNNEEYILDNYDFKIDNWELYDETEYFDFNQVLKYLEEGKCVSRKNWKKLSCHHQYIFKDKTDKKLYNDREERIYWIADEDIFAKDWFLIDNENNL